MIAFIHSHSVPSWARHVRAFSPQPTSPPYRPLATRIPSLPPLIVVDGLRDWLPSQPHTIKNHAVHNLSLNGHSRNSSVSSSLQEPALGITEPNKQGQQPQPNSRLYTASTPFKTTRPSRTLFIHLPVQSFEPWPPGLNPDSLQARSFSTAYCTTRTVVLLHSRHRLATATATSSRLRFGLDAGESCPRWACRAD